MSRQLQQSADLDSGISMHPRHSSWVFHYTCVITDRLNWRMIMPSIWGTIQSWSTLWQTSYNSYCWENPRTLSTLLANILPHFLPELLNQQRMPPQLHRHPSLRAELTLWWVSLKIHRRKRVRLKNKHFCNSRLHGGDKINLILVFVNKSTIMLICLE